MSDKPRVFVSAVSSEFGQTRQDVANILTRLGFEPVLQDVFGTEPGDLRQMLREKIDTCHGLIHIVGQAYGFELPAPDEEFGRVPSGNASSSDTACSTMARSSLPRKVWIEPRTASVQSLVAIEV